MYFVIIMAFALILSDGLPPAPIQAWWKSASGSDLSILGGIAGVLAYLGLLAGIALIGRHRAFAELDGSDEGRNEAAAVHSNWQSTLIVALALGLAGLIILTPWPVLVRTGLSFRGFTPGDVPLIGDLLVLTPFLLGLLITWTIAYGLDVRIRFSELPATPLLNADHPEARFPFTALHSATAATAPTLTLTRTTTDPPVKLTDAHEAARPSTSSRPHPTSSLATYLFDKLRHQILIVAVPMCIIVLAKFFTDSYKQTLNPALAVRGKGLSSLLSLPWMPDAMLGIISALVLGCAPVMLRYIWSTQPLPAGPLRDRFEKTCRRIGLKYREILLWNTHGTAVNAAVMGFIGPMRYILVSDALLDCMDDDEIEAVFAHEAGHVRHWHLQYFILFALVSMFVAGGVLLLLVALRLVQPNDQSGMLQLASLGALMSVWLFGFGAVSRRFERQADLYGVRAITPDIVRCVDWCPVHGVKPREGLCAAAANLFGRTLAKIADLNGIPRDAPSWRHGTIESRCRLIESLASDQAALRRFDQSVRNLKIVLLLVTLIGILATILIYGNSVLSAWGLPLMPLPRIFN